MLLLEFVIFAWLTPFPFPEDLVIFIQLSIWEFDLSLEFAMVEALRFLLAYLDCIRDLRESSEFIVAL